LAAGCKKPIAGANSGTKLPTVADATSTAASTKDGDFFLS